ncbi:MAG: aromatic ring-hydroxylating oxygenase subunit alpha [Pseudomonadales bacterium]
MSDLLEEVKHHASMPLDQAKALPFESYTSKELYELERMNVFHNDWVFVCAEKELPETGDYFAFTLAEEPVIVVRGKDGRLRAMSNVCRHRGTILSDPGVGNAKRFVCPYHAWTYDNEGNLSGVPFPGDVDVNKIDHCLPQFSLCTWQGLVFLSLNSDVKPLGDRLAGIESYLQRFQNERFAHAVQSQSEHWDTNWKLAMENAMESYHLFRVHKETLETVTPTKDAFYVEGSSEWAITAGKMVGVTSKLWNWLMSDDDKMFENYLLICIPPSFVGILTYESWDWISVLPENAHQSLIRAAGLTISDKGESADVTEFVSAFFAEDKEICERVQRGMHAKHTKGGQLVELERIVVDFHHYLASRLFGIPPSDSFETAARKVFIPP